MASKLNRKFILVVGGFSAAAILLLVAVVLVNQLWIKNAERHIRSGDELVAQGKLREAINMYGRAVAKKPEMVPYIAKMEETLGKVVADTPAQSAEDYRTLMSLRRARTRAQPGDPEQWRALLDSLEAETELYARGEGWLTIEGVAKEMKDVMPPGSDGLRQAEEMLLYARAQRSGLLTSGERTDLERQLEAFLKVSPKSWRGWSALVKLRTDEVGRLRGAGQEQAAVRKAEALDKSLAEMRAALEGSDSAGRCALAMAEVDRLLMDGRNGSRLDREKLDAPKLDAACARLSEAAMASGSGLMVRASAGRLGDAKGIEAGAELLRSWNTSHPTDLLSGGYELEYVSRMGETGFDRTREVAKRILDTPTLPTGIDASIQSETRARALQVLIDSAIVQAAREGLEPAKKAELEAQLPGLRADLLKSLQNDESAPGMLIADAKILQSRGDLPAAAKKWEIYFQKVPQPPADAFLWSAMVSRAQNDLGLAMQTATRGSDAYPSDLRLAIQRAELAAQLGKFAEAAALFEALAKAIPSEQRFARMAEETRRRVSGERVEAAPEVAQIEEALRAKDWARARELSAAWVKSSDGSLQAMYGQALVEQEAGDKAKALELIRAALAKHPPTAELARMEAMLATEDPLERVDIMIARMVPDEKQRPAERIRALRGLRSDLTRQVAELRRASSPELPASEAFLAKVVAALGDTEKQVTAAGGTDPAMIEIAFNESVSRGDFAAAEVHIAAASKVTASVPALEPILRARLLEAQGRVGEAIAVLEKARQGGRNEAPLAAQLAVLQERAGNEPASMALWKEAYDRRPNDLTNVRGYARAMGRAGQGKSALEMLRAAIAANPADLETLIVAAEFEAVYGARSRAIELRQRALQLDSTNRENLAELYTLLNLPADSGSVRDEQGRSRFDDRAWSAVPVEEQRRLLADAERANKALAEQVFQAAMRTSPYDMRFAMRRAAVQREAGQAADAAQTVQDVIARAESDGKATAIMYVEQGTYFDTLGDVAAADAAFAKAAKLQDPAKREVDLVLVEVYARRGEVKRAIEALDAAMASSPTLPGLLRLADLHLVAQDAAGASKVLERVRPMAGDKASQEVQRQIEMLASGIAATEAEILRRDGKIAEAQKKVEDALAALTRAETVAPADLVAPLRRVQLLRALAVGQQDPARLEQAITEADRALARNALYWQMVSTRADLALDKRDIKAAIGIIERFLEAQPASEEARIRLMEMQLAAGSGDRAVETARGGIRLRPQDPRWAERLGDLLEATGDQAGAATEYERAFSLDPKSMGYLEKATLARLNAGGAADTLALLRGANELVQRSPVLRAIGAAALARSGRRDDALVAGREALSAARAAKADDLLTAERTVLMLREMFPPEKPADFEAYLTQAGTPSAVESALLADAWARSGPAGADKALEWCGKIEAQGESVPPGVRASAAMTRGGALYGKGDLPAATDAFVAAATISPRNAAALNNAAYLVAKVKGDNAKAFEFASKAVVLAPAQPDYLDTLGYVLMRSGRMAEAEDALNKSVAVSPTASALMHLAQLRAAQGNFGEARQIVDRAKARPADPDTAKELQEFAASLQGK